MLFDLKVPFLGFESVRRFDLQKIDDVFMRLTAEEGSGPSFTLINPFVLRDYAFDIPTPIQTLMEINDGSNLLIFNIVVVNSPLESSTVNFAAPLVFNTDNATMAQVILSDQSEYDIAEPITKFLETKSDA